MHWGLAFTLMVVAGRPDMAGFATFYSDGSIFRHTGAAYDSAEWGCAIDTSEFMRYAGDTLLVVFDSGKVANLPVLDSGLLYDVGLFVPHRDWERYPYHVKVGSSVAGTGIPAPVVVDIPKDTFLSIAGTDATQRVFIWPAITKQQFNDAADRRFGR